MRDDVAVANVTTTWHPDVVRQFHRRVENFFRRVLDGVPEAERM
jgi:hypothetical protein